MRRRRHHTRKMRKLRNRLALGLVLGIAVVCVLGIYLGSHANSPHVTGGMSAPVLEAEE